MKIKKTWLRLALVVLVLAVLFFGGFFRQAESPVPPAAAPGDALVLLTEPPAAAEATPSPAQEPEAQQTETPAEQTQSPEAEETLAEDGVYTSAEDVALYLHLYGRLPSNFITKSEAKKAGWPGGSLEPYFPGMCIGGDRFGNREGKLPTEKGRTWYECDVNTLGADERGAERLVYSSDGLIYYTADHYESFTRLY